MYPSTEKPRAALGYADRLLVLLNQLDSLAQHQYLALRWILFPIGSFREWRARRNEAARLALFEVEVHSLDRRALIEVAMTEPDPVIAAAPAAELKRRHYA